MKKHPVAARVTRRPFARWPLAAALASATAAVLVACSAGAPPSSSPSASGGTTPPHSPSATPEPAVTSWGPLEDDLAAATDAVAQMTPEQKAGQVLVQYYTGADPSGALAAAEELHLGGVIIMGDNVPTTTLDDGTAGADVEALEATVTDFRATMEAGRDWPGIVGIDQEGGRVARLQTPLTEWSTPMAFGAADDPELTASAQRALAGDLAELGFTMNFSPDADVTIGPSDPVIGARSYSSDPARVAKHARAAVGGSLEAGILPSLKHFPGHGSVTTDSHVGLPVQSATLEDLQARDWVPFAQPGGEQQASPMVMVGHIAVDALEPGVPSSLSSAAYAALREDVGFEGVAVTDALNMGALSSSATNPAATALAAGADLLLMPADVRAAHAAILAGLEDGTIPAERLDEAATRVVAMMMWQERLAGEAAGTDGGEETTSEDVALEAARAAATQVTGTCGEPLVGEAIQIIGGNERDRARLAEAARQAGLGVGYGDVVVLLGNTLQPASGDVVVTLDAPWALDGSAANNALVALFGRNPASFTALVEVLTGEWEAPGKLPVDVGQYPAGTGC